MKKDEFIKTIKSLLSEYIEGRIKSNVMIHKYDNLMVDEFPWGTDDINMKKIEEFQDELAFYVENPELRKEDEHYYGPDVLHKKITEFLSFFNE